MKQGSEILYTASGDMTDIEQCTI